MRIRPADDSVEDKPTKEFPGHFSPIEKEWERLNEVRDLSNPWAAIRSLIFLPRHDGERLAEVFLVEANPASILLGPVVPLCDEGADAPEVLNSAFGDVEVKASSGRHAQLFDHVDVADHPRVWLQDVSGGRRIVGNSPLPLG